MYKQMHADPRTIESCYSAMYELQQTKSCNFDENIELEIVCRSCLPAGHGFYIPTIQKFTFN